MAMLMRLWKFRYSAEDWFVKAARRPLLAGPFFGVVEVFSIGGRHYRRLRVTAKANFPLPFAPFENFCSGEAKAPRYGVGVQSMNLLALYCQYLTQLSDHE